MQKLELLTSQIEELEAKRNELLSLKEPIDKKLVSNYDLLSKIKGERDAILLESKQDDWEWLLKDANNSSIEKCEFVFNKLFDMGLYYLEFCVETNQVSICVKLTKYCPKSLEKTLASLKILLPHIKILSNGTKNIRIFEHSLSKYGSYHLSIIDNSYVLYYGQESVVESFSSLRKALEYIQEHHWYDKNNALPEPNAGETSSKT